MQRGTEKTHPHVQEILTKQQWINRVPTFLQHKNSLLFQDFLQIKPSGLPARSPKNYKGSKVLFRKNKGKIKIQRGQIYDPKPRMSDIYSALEWSIQTPVTVLTY